MEAQKFLHGFELDRGHCVDVRGEGARLEMLGIRAANHKERRDKQIIAPYLAYGFLQCLVGIVVRISYSGRWRRGGNIPDHAREPHDLEDPNLGHGARHPRR